MYIWSFFLTSFHSKMFIMKCMNDVTCIFYCVLFLWVKDLN